MLYKVRTMVASHFNAGEPENPRASPSWREIELEFYPNLSEPRAFILHISTMLANLTNSACFKTSVDII